MSVGSLLDLLQEVRIQPTVALLALIVFKTIQGVLDCPLTAWPVADFQPLEV